MRISLAFKSIIFSVLVPGTVVIYLPYLILGQSKRLPQLLDTAHVHPAMVGLLVGAGIYIRCAWDFAVSGQGTPAPLDPPKNLVIVGLYRWTRNPMYLGVLTVLLAEAAFFLSRELTIYVASIAMMLHLAVVFYEEPLLRARFGPDYSSYCREVPRWGIARRPYSLNTG